MKKQITSFLLVLLGWCVFCRECPAQLTEIELPSYESMQLSKFSSPDFFYDYSGDGNFWWYQEDAPSDYAPTKCNFLRNRLVGNMLYRDTLKFHILDGGDFTFRPVNLNNDRFPDFMVDRKYAQRGYESLMLYSNRDGGYELFDGATTPYICDYNNDGLTDIFLPPSHVLQRQPDGAYFKTEITVLSGKDETTLYEQWNGGGSFLDNMGSCMHMEMPVYPGKPFTSMTPEGRFYSMDFNKDGLPDLINPQLGLILYNRGNNRFAANPLSGSVYAKDLNGDMIPDYIMYDELGKTITSLIYQGNGKYKETQLLKNYAMDKNIYFYDLDKDGDVDILIPFSYTEALGYSILIVFQNDGKGNFETVENFFEKKLTFIDCADVDNDGYYEMLARNWIDGWLQLRGIPEVYLISRDKGLNYREPVEPWFTLGDKEDYLDTLQPFARDIDNDGIAEVCMNYLNSLFVFRQTGVRANQPPAKMKAPAIVFDGANGLLKINWESATDKESSVVDLTYALRIGSAPGLSDMYYADANADGSRRNFRQGNMGNNRDVTLNVASWNIGKYYVSVQAVDPMFKGSSWSDETVFEKQAPQASFVLSDKTISTPDTLTICYNGRANSAFTYVWDLDGAAIVESTPDSTLLKVIWETPGNKTVRLCVTDKVTNYATVLDQKLAVNPNRLFAVKGSGDEYGILCDFNGDGFVDKGNNGGLFSNDGKGVFKKIPGLFNTDLKIKGKAAIVLDHNRDGLPDVLSWQGADNAYILVNKGDNKFDRKESKINEKFAFEGFYDPGSFIPFADLDNDGYIDFVWISKDSYLSQTLPCGTIWKNGGDNTTFNPVPVYANSMKGGGGDQTQLVDINGDGYIDIIPSGQLWENDNKFFVILENQGGLKFKERALTVPVEYRDMLRYPRFADFNNDGLMDMVSCDYEKRKMGIFVNDGNTLFNDVRELETGVPYLIIHDFDNNGYPDILIQDDYKRICYFYPGLETKLVVDPLDVQKIFVEHDYVDIDGDSVPDMPPLFNRSRVRNSAPSVPVNIRANQTEQGTVLVEWDAAHDAETPACQMRYNLSVKKKGAVGADSFIISPLNGLKDGAAIVSLHSYMRATRFEIPLSVMPAGEYEVQVQSIDAWSLHSPMSAPANLKVETKPLIRLPESVCVDMAAEITYIGTASSGLAWNWDGGILLSENSGNTYDVKWSMPGVKTITVETDGVTARSSFLVKPAIKASVLLPGVVIKNTEVRFMLPQDAVSPGRTYRFLARKTGDKNFTEPEKLGITILRKSGTAEAKAEFTTAGEYVIGLEITDSGCGIALGEKTVEVKAALDAPLIKWVSMDEATGKNKIYRAPVAVPEYVTAIRVYKESIRYNQFEPIGEMNLSDASFVDISSDPNISTSRYQLRYNTSFGVESAPGTTHSSTHLMINRGIGNSWNLIWNRYEGEIVDTYRIFRGSRPDEMRQIAEIAGSATSFSDMTAPEGVCYYVLELEMKAGEEWQSMSRRSEIAAARSNVVNVSNAASVVFVESVYIRCLEQQLKLDPAQKQIHLYAELYPVTAAYKNVNWIVTEGNDIAYINSYGLLTATEKKSGTVTVRATTVDGSNISAELQIPVSGFVGVEIEAVGKNRDELILYPSPVRDILRIEGIPASPGGATVYVMNMNGQLIAVKKVQETYTEISCGNYPAGIYAVKVVGDRGMASKRFIKE